MKDYELVVVFHPDLEMNLDPVLTKVKKVIESAGGTITKEEAEGKKRLAYQIKGQDYGIYYYFELQLPTTAPAKINSVLSITDEILRPMLVKSDPRRAKYEALKKERAAEAKDDAKDEAKDEEEEA